MVDVPADAARNAGNSPEEGARGAFAFAGLVFDLDALTLKRESGEAIELTRGEFALLREFVRRPGRVLSRDLLLDAMAGRRNVPFDRSVDVMVGRLRKKVEPDPKQPSVIQTVPGEGYRFVAPLSPRKPVAEAVGVTTAASPEDTAIPPAAAIPDPDCPLGSTEDIVHLPGAEFRPQFGVRKGGRHDVLVQGGRSLWVAWYWRDAAAHCGRTRRAGSI